jgi:Na+-transporting NADH:ubiquinone oxidoreductase subunit C
MQHSTGYIIAFATAVCFVCALVVATSAVGLKERQEANLLVDRQKKVLGVAGLLREGESISNEEVQQLFAAEIVSRVVNLETGDYSDEVDPSVYDQRAASKDPDKSYPVPQNDAKIRRIPKLALIYQVMSGGEVKLVILPVEGKGLWSTLYGYLALLPDTTTVEGITFYEHGETPGLGGEVDNPRWKKLWKGRLAFDDKWEPAIRVKKGAAGPPDTDPHQVDGLSGATITSRGVSSLVRFWLGDQGFGPYLEQLRSQTSG